MIAVIRGLGMYVMGCWSLGIRRARGASTATVHNVFIQPKLSLPRSESRASLFQGSLLH